jgi:hypothetical protein
MSDVWIVMTLFFSFWAFFFSFRDIVDQRFFFGGSIWHRLGTSCNILSRDTGFPRLFTFFFVVCASFLLFHAQKRKSKTDSPSKSTASVNADANVSGPGVRFAGYLEKRGQLNTAWKKRWCVIRDDKLYYYKAKENAKHAGIIPLQQAVVRVRTVCVDHAHLSLF